MNPNPFLGLFFHWPGGLDSDSFYVPDKGVPVSEAWVTEVKVCEKNVLSNCQ